MSQDPNDLRDFLAGNSPNPEAGVAAPNTPPATQDQKLGEVLNDNARLRAEMDAMRLEMGAYRAERERTQAQQPQADPQAEWHNWVRTAMKEAQIPDSLWIESPNEAFVRGSAALGRHLWDAMREDTKKQATEIANWMRLDEKFENRYPDLYATEIGRIAVSQAIYELRPQGDWQMLMRNAGTIPQGLDRIASLARKKLGQADLRPEGATSPPPTRRRGTYGESPGGRPGGEPVSADVQSDELDSMMKYARGERSG